jgi:hypothetical protein
VEHVNRHPAVAGLTQDHQVALLHAQRLAQAAETGPQEALKASRGYLNWHTHVFLAHLEEEQQLLGFVEPAMRARYQMLEEHVRNCSDELRITLMDPTFFRPAVRNAAAAVREHVAYCEANLIAEVQALLEPAELEALGKRLLAYRKVNRPLSLGSQPTEPAYLQ